MSVVAAIRAMLEQGLSIDQALAAGDAIELAQPAPRTARQERNRRYYETHRASETSLKASESVLKASETSYSDAAPSPLPAPSPDKEIPPTPPKENNLFPYPTPQPRVSRAGEFDRFWAMFPNKVGKADAFKAFDRAIKRVELETMMAGLDRYVHKTDDRPWCNPATWLNQDRWNDQPAAAMPRASPNRPISALETQTQRLKEKIANDYGFGREESRYSQDVAPLRITSIKAD